jgi:iron-sulfur cluster assembly accessory protein
MLDQTTPSQSVTVSANAAGQISKILANEAEGAFLRVSVLGGGCSGFQYEFVIDKQFNDDDLIIERDGISVAVDATSLAYLEGSEIDYVTDLIGSSFQVQNPNAQTQCGCGTSFSI